MAPRAQVSNRCGFTPCARQRRFAVAQHARTDDPPLKRPNSGDIAQFVATRNLGGSPMYRCARLLSALMVSSVWFFFSMSLAGAQICSPGSSAANDFADGVQVLQQSSTY